MKQEERRDAKARSTQRNLKFPSLIATLIAVVASCKAPSTPRTSDIQGQWFGRCVFACPDSVRKEEWPSDTLLLALVFDSALHGEYLGYVGNDKGYPMLRGKFSALEASDTIVFERMKLIAWTTEIQGTRADLKVMNALNGCACDLTMRSFTGERLPLLP